MASSSIITPPGFSKSTLGTGSALSSEKSTLVVLMKNYRSHSLRVRPMSIRSSLEQNAPNSKAATLYSLGKNAAALALSYFFGSLLGREEIAQLLFGQISNLAAKGTAPVHYGVGAAALLFVMGALIGHKWAAKSGSHCPNVFLTEYLIFGAGTCNGSNDSEHMPTDNRPTKRASVKRKALRKVKRSVKVVNDGVSTSKLIQMLLKVVLEMLKLP